MTTIRPVALVTGGASGIGSSVGLALRDAGYEVVGTSRRTSGITPPPGVTLLDLDVADDESVAAAVEQVIGRFGRIDVLVNNAGVGFIGAAEDSSVSNDQGVFDINVFGLIRMTKAVLPHMRSRGHGRIINISSVGGLVPMPYMAIYSASKHAVEGYSESLDHEVREHGVRVLLIEPSWIKTGIDVNSVKPDAPVQVYAERRRAAEQLLADSVANGEDPAVVAKVVVAAATDKNPKLRYAAGALAPRIGAFRRFAPSGVFDRQLRKMSKLTS
ncbi:short-chain dehydrogenase/reductase (plasmid) [Mycolicibacterium arabiense]|uniref:Short-chain dehydrogenase/reductase n=1 Tax=Mycolicibacterium arabiense TaxID=1286181 RepID=A0A7I7RQU1_9MYCO|nr:oxidoreductase [Mycolicibacterium arabiense]MCV7372017.1 SDR family NAD(P)-dependent oxidoreductase [Mycolicibacterium arabiense]BBY46660.1 short-chain dehydrogenase/reductase [Mycolicibacterium arabiense]